MADKDPGYSPFVQAVAGDGTSPPDVRMLPGWLGPASEDGYSRLYLDPSLSSYVDIPRDAILYSEEIPNSHPAGARTVWVKGDADLKEGGSAIARASKFLSGAVQQDFLGGGGSDAAAQAPQTYVCLTHKPGCERTGITGDCQSSLNPCITQTEIGPRCGFTRIPCSAIDACPTRLCQQEQAPGRPFTQLSCSAIGACNSAVCPQADFQAQAGGPAPTVGFCVPRTNTCPINGPTRFCVPRTQRCPSALDACPSSLGCTFACNVDFQQAAAGKQLPIPLPGPGTSNFCVTADCQTPVIACPDPNPSVNKFCSTQVPALCPNVPLEPRMAQCVGQTFQTGASCPCPPQTGVQCQPPATMQNCPPVSQHPPQCCFGQTFQTGIQGCQQDVANFAGWTVPYACPYHSYPACNSHIPCATAPPCF